MKYRTNATFDAYQVTQERIDNNFSDAPEWFKNLYDLPLDKRGAIEIVVEGGEQKVYYNFDGLKIIKPTDYLCRVKSGKFDLLQNIPKEEFESQYEPEHNDPKKFSEISNSPEGLLLMVAIGRIMALSGTENRNEIFEKLHNKLFEINVADSQHKLDQIANDIMKKF